MHLYLTPILFVGQTGLGKSTLINTIFASHLIDSKGRFASDEPVRKTTEIQAVSHGMFVSWSLVREFCIVGLLVFDAWFFLHVTRSLSFGTYFLQFLKEKDQC